jgi:hypothetical protein
MPAATLIEYDGAPHGLFATEKERFTRDLIDFIGGAKTGFMLQDDAAAMSELMTGEEIRPATVR